MPDIKPDEMHAALRQNTEAMVKFGVRLDAVEQRLGTWAAHAENISRSVEQTAHILEMERADRKAKELREEERAHQLEVREREQEAAREAAQAEKATWWRTVGSKVAAELWGVFKVPLGSLVLAVCGYYAWLYFGGPIPMGGVDVQVVEQVEGITDVE